MKHPVVFPPALVRFVERFNREEFWESHEVLEDAWRASRSDFYHGLILYASAFVHVQRANAHGVVAQLQKTQRTLSPYAPEYLGIDLADILERSRGIRERLEGRDGAEEGWEADVSFPRLRLDPERIRGSEPELDEQ
ncbi:MAG: DUF309 domain-containing protein [Gemmatimonadota bacterium]